jgi:serine/threonine protein kinase
VVDDGTGGAWLVMEDLGGASLAVVLRDENHLCTREAVYVGQHVLDALVALHGAGLVHRDVKHVQAEIAAGTLVVDVRDDGCGGADPLRGSGLTGRRRRASPTGLSGHLAGSLRPAREG